MPVQFHKNLTYPSMLGSKRIVPPSYTVYKYADIPNYQHILLHASIYSQKSGAPSKQPSPTARLYHLWCAHQQKPAIYGAQKCALICTSDCQNYRQRFS